MSCVSSGVSGGCSTGGGCGGSCGSGGCNKLNSFDWLGDMAVPVERRFKIIEVRFKNGRKDFFSNSDSLELYTGDPVIVNLANGMHLGFVSLQGELVRLQLKKKKIDPASSEIKTVVRKATEKDIEKYEQAKTREFPALFRTREIINQLQLKMKLSDIEFQYDNAKATFYYSADDRVDFRELIKLLASEFKVRVEMKQINLRQEAGMLGGIGVCGRELCCSTWLTDFKNVSTSAARYQNLSLNPAKLSGQCGRLKCCLNYELETYMDALSDIPKVEAPIKTGKGNAILQKTDIFRKLMWFSYTDESNWVCYTADEVHDMIAQNSKGIVVIVEDTGVEVGIKKEMPLPGLQLYDNEMKKLDKKYKSGKKPNKNKNRNNRNNNRGENPPSNFKKL